MRIPIAFRFFCQISSISRSRVVGDAEADVVRAVAVLGPGVAEADDQAELRLKPPSWLGAIVNGPVRKHAYSRPIIILPAMLLAR